MKFSTFALFAIWNPIYERNMELGACRRNHRSYQDQSSSFDPDRSVSSGDSVLSKHDDKPSEKDATCIFCCQKYSDDHCGEIWIQCQSCGLRAHNECAGCEREYYICDFCK